MKINEKLELSLQNAKIKEVLQYGQILIEGTQKETGFINLCNPEATWNNPKLINKRITPVSAATVTDMITQIKYYSYKLDFKLKQVTNLSLSSTTSYAKSLFRHKKSLFYSSTLAK